jgi:predicted DNA-binding protein with PD1-like motif
VRGPSLLGDIAIGDDGKAGVHIHAVLGLCDSTTRGGRFLTGIVRPALDVTITESLANLCRKK